MNESCIKLCCDAADGQIKTGTNVSSLSWRHKAQNCLLVILGQVRGHTHPRDFSRRLAGEPTISPRVQWTCPRKSCHGGQGGWWHLVGWRETKFWSKGRGSLGVSGRVTKSSGEELINVKSIVRLELGHVRQTRTLKSVGFQGGEGGGRERERGETGQQQWHNRAYHGTEGTRLKYQTVINPMQEKRSRYEEEQIGRVATAPQGGGWGKKKVKGLDRWRAMNETFHTRNILSSGQARNDDGSTVTGGTTCGTCRLYANQVRESVLRLNDVELLKYCIFTLING